MGLVAFIKTKFFGDKRYIKRHVDVPEPFTILCHGVILGTIFVVGFLIRVVLLKDSSTSKLLSNRIEISTPISSWKRVTEGISLMEKEISPYEGDLFHESPLLLELYKFINLVGDHRIPLVFAMVDILTGILVTFSSASYMRNLAWRERKQEKYNENASTLLVEMNSLPIITLYVALIYLFSPYAVASCCGKSTTVFLNFFISLFMASAISGLWMVAPIFLGIVSYYSLYHITLLMPLIMFILEDSFRKQKVTILNICKAVLSTCIFIAVLSFLLYASYIRTGSWQFLKSTYGFALSVPDLTPNVGLFWYFFTEMFEHFRVFFLWTFQLNAFIYSIPLAIRFRKEPMLLLFIHLMIIALFKSYPSVGDINMYMVLLPLWSHLFIFMRQSFLVGCGFVACTVLAPLLWHLWIYSGSANANFYFATTLAFNTSQIFLMTDLLSAYIKREYYLIHGIPTDAEGKLSPLRLR